MANENNNVVAGLNIELGATANKAQINGEINKVLTALDAIGKHQSKVKIDASDLSKLNKIINDITSKIGSNNTITSRVKNNLTTKLREGFEGAMPQMRKVVHDNIRSLTAEMEKAISQMQRGKFVNTAQLKTTKDKVSNLSNLYETLGLSGVNNSKALQGLQNTFRLYSEKIKVPVPPAKVQEIRKEMDKLFQLPSSTVEETTAKIEAIAKKIEEFNRRLKRNQKGSVLSNELDKGVSTLTDVNNGLMLEKSKAIEQEKAEAKKEADKAKKEADTIKREADKKAIKEERENIAKSNITTNSLLSMPAGNVEEARAKVNALNAQMDKLVGLKQKLDNDPTNKFLQQEYKNAQKLTVEIERLNKELQGTKYLSNIQLKSGLDINNKPIDIKNVGLLQSYQTELSKRMQGGNIYSKDYIELAAAKQRMTSYERIATGQMDAYNRKLEEQINTVKRGHKVHSEFINLLKSYVSVYAIRDIGREIVNITAQFDMQKRALGALIGDQSKAVSIFAQIKANALQSPFSTLDITGQAKQLAAFGVQAKDLVNTTKMLGDIAAGTGADMSRLILAFGQVKSAEFLRGQEARQFSEAGVPLIDALSQKYSKLEGHLVSMGDVYKRISERGVSFKDVAEALQNMTEKGGRFYNMQGVIAETTYGRMENLHDAMQQSFDKLGKSSNGLINTVLSGLTNIAKNLSGYMKTVLLLSGIWGAYRLRRAAMIKTEEEFISKQKLTDLYAKRAGNFDAMATASRRQGNVKDEKVYSYMADYNMNKGLKVESSAKAMMELKKNIAEIKVDMSETNNIAKKTQLTFKLLGKTTILWGIALKGILIETGIGILLAALTGIVGKIWAAHDAAKEFQKSLDDIDKESLKKTQEMSDQLPKLATEALAAADGSAKQEQALSKLVETYGEVLPAESLTIEHLRSMNGNYKELTNTIAQYNRIKALQDKKDVITDNYIGGNGQDDKFSKALNYSIRNTATRGFESSVGFTKNDKEKYMPQLEEEIRNGAIKSVDELNKRLKALTGEKYFIDISTRESGKIYDLFDSLKNINNQIRNTENGYYGGEKQGDAVREYNKYIDKQQEVIANAISVKEYQQESLNLQTKSGKEINNILIASNKRTMSEKEIDEFLNQGINANQIGLNLNQEQINAINAIRNGYMACNGGINANSVANNNILSSLQAQNMQLSLMKTFLVSMSDTPMGYYANVKMAADDAKNTLDNFFNSAYMEEGYYTELTNSDRNFIKNHKNAADIRAYYGITNEGKNMIGNLPLSEKQRQIYAITGAMDTLKKYHTEYKDIDKTQNGGRTRTQFDAVNDTIREQIELIKKAREQYRDYQEYFVDSKAISKTDNIFKDQFKNIAPQYKGITGKDLFVQLVQNDSELSSDLEKYFNHVSNQYDKEKAKGKKANKNKLKGFFDDKMLIQEFKGDIDKSLIDKRISDFTKAINKEVDNTRNRIDLFQKLTEETGNTNLSYNIATNFYGEGTFSRLGTMKETLIKMATEAGSIAGADFKDMLQKAFNDADFNWNALDDFLDQNKIPEKFKEQMQQMLSEYKKSQLEMYQDALKYYKNNQTLEEKRVMLVEEAERKISEIKKMNLDEQSKNKAINSIQLGLQKDTMAIQLESINQSQFYLDLFNNIEKAGKNSLAIMYNSLMNVRKASKDLKPTELKELNEQIEKIRKVLQPKTYKIEDIFKLPKKEDIENIANTLQGLYSKKDKLTHKGNKLASKGQNLRDNYDKIEQNISTDILPEPKEVSYILSPEEQDKKRTQIAWTGTEAMKNYKNNGKKSITDAIKQNSDEQDKNTDEVENVDKEIEQQQQKLLEYESIHNNAYEQMQHTIDAYNEDLSNMAETATSTLQPLQDVYKLMKGKESKNLADSIQAVNEALSTTQGVIRIVSSFLKTYQGIITHIANAKKASIAIDKTANKEQAKGNALKTTSAVAESADATAKTANAGATGAATIAQEGFNLALYECPLVWILAAIMAVIGAYKIFTAINNNNLQDQIDDLDDKVKKLDKDIQAIENSMKKTAGNDYVSKMRQKLEDLRKQSELAQQQLELEKKKTKPDEKEVQSYVDKIDDAKQKAEEYSQTMFEWFAGGDITSLMENIVGVFTQAREAGQNTFNALKKSFAEMVSNMIQKSIMADVIKKHFQSVFDTITDMTENGGMSTADVKRLVAQGIGATQRANNALRALYPVIQGMNNALGVTSSTAGGLTAGIKGMTEETAGTLTGVMMANLNHVSGIDTNIMAIRRLIEDNSSVSGVIQRAKNSEPIAIQIMSEYQERALQNLVAIEANTKLTATELQGVHTEVSDLKGILTSMRGVNINATDGVIYGMKTIQ